MSTPRWAKVATAQSLRAQGLTVSEIAERMGVATSTASAYLSDPDLSKQRARRERYAVPCSSCGGPTDGSGGYAHSTTICQACREWSDEEIIEAIRAWAAEHGGIPPREVDWRGATEYPSPEIIRRRIGWNRALGLAGFAPHHDRSPERQAWVEEQIRAGRSTREIADEMGVGSHAIHYRMYYRGTTVNALRREAGLLR